MPLNAPFNKMLANALLLLAGMLFANMAFAVQVPDAASMIKNISTQIPQLMKMVTAIGYVMGFFFVIKGVVGLKVFGEMRSMASGQHSIKGPLIYLTVGTLLIYLPSAVNVGLGTFWSNPNPYGYIDQEDQWNEIFGICFTVIQLFGTIAFIRGLVILSSLGGGSGQPGTFGKGMTHIIGGIFCINIYEFIKMVFATLGVTGVPGFN